MRSGGGTWTSVLMVWGARPCSSAARVTSTSQWTPAWARSMTTPRSTAAFTSGRIFMLRSSMCSGWPLKAWVEMSPGPRNSSTSGSGMGVPLTWTIRREPDWSATARAARMAS